ncbi:hypothetical protein [Kitasatospora kifunensis]|uniref:CARDB domain-containing protein n=1 Tax=Kitasatospora kifunensis TaxID=58351 RepID=A0A7W7RAT9_KITKI|nr:hypothetical protein [Kitasatospora kifunensis]MBB4928615.1 hypothetical protein [Kitasatospora kifunensis]
MTIRLKSATLGSLAAAAAFTLAVPPVAEASTTSASPPQVRAITPTEEKCHEAKMFGRDQTGHEGRVSFRLCASTDGNEMTVDASNPKCERYALLSWQDYDYNCVVSVKGWTLEKGGKVVARNDMPSIVGTYPGPGTYSLVARLHAFGQRHVTEGYVRSHFDGDTRLDVTFASAVDRPKPPKPASGPRISASATRANGVVTVTVTNSGDRASTKLNVVYRSLNARSSDQRCHVRNSNDGMNECQFPPLGPGESTTLVVETSADMRWVVYDNHWNALAKGSSSAR